jgi:hypothetical protein
MAFKAGDRVRKSTGEGGTIITLNIDGTSAYVQIDGGTTLARLERLPLKDLTRIDGSGEASNQDDASQRERLKIEVGDWVRTPAGNIGRVEYIARLSAYVQFGQAGPETLKSYLVSELVKVDPPITGASKSSGPHTS